MTLRFSPRGPEHFYLQPQRLYCCTSKTQELKARIFLMEFLAE